MDSKDAAVGDYEVFLSFRGADTRQGFTDVLYEYMTMAEIRVFRDDDELAIGDKIESILQAIGSSKICIPIFSPKFAESKWCLREVSRMMELKKTIVPVFYKVSPDDVKLKKTSVYLDEFRKLKEKHENLEEIPKWKNALKEAASNKGRELREKSYTKFCKELVDEVLFKLGPRKRLEIDHLVGVDNKMAAMELLDMESREVVYIGIYGMGGIGKTTIAKSIYNEFMSSFDHCAFVSDIREFSTSNGVKGLPKYLYDNLEPKSVIAFSRSNQIVDRFSKKKVLIVLDDVDSCEQIQEIAKDPNWFGSGSRIIVTTREKNALEEYRMLQGTRSEVRYLEMKELERGWALELFSKCAFGTDSPPSLYQNLSKRAVAYAGGLPLTITVIAKCLRNKKVRVWEDFIERLKKAPPKEVKDKLMISYESLEDEEKVIFLDIACLFIGEKLTETSRVFYMWQDCGLFPSLSLEILQLRSLVKISEFDHLRMHDQLRDLGRYIVRTQGKGDLTKQSRLWEGEAIREVLQCKEKSKENIEALRLPDGYNNNNNLTLEEFSSFDNLRFLSLGWSKLQGKFSGLLPQLRCLSSSGHIFEDGNLVLSNLVVLELFGSDADENWGGWNQIQSLKKLKVLYVYNFDNLRRTPEFAENMALERLVFKECAELVSVDPSIGKLQHLNYLSLFCCEKLKILPESLGNLHSLRKLVLELTDIIALPDSIGRLERLEHLNLTECESLVNLPQSLVNLPSLVGLDISYTNITTLPSSVGRLKKLQSLDLHKSEIKLLTESIGDLRSLVHLHLFGTEIAALPDSIGQLENLELLDLSSCEKIHKLPDSIGKLKSLQKLDLSGTGITALPESVGGLGKLKDLDLSRSKIRQLPSTINQLSLLQTLKLEECDDLQELAELPTSLNGLSIKSNALHIIPDLSYLQHLSLLKIIGNCTMDWHGSFPNKFRSLTVKLLRTCRLPDLSNCLQLINLQIESCHVLKEIHGIGRLQCLASLCIRDCPSLVCLENLRELKLLRELELFNCKKLTEIPGLGELLRLTSLHVESCSSLLSLENLRELQQLKHFKLVSCRNLTEIPGLGKLQGLTKVILEDCDSFVIFGSNIGKALYNSDVEEHGIATHPFTTKKLKEIGGEVAVGETKGAWRKHQSEIRSVLVFDACEFVTSSDGSRSLPISELEGKVVGLYFSHPLSLSGIEFTLDLLDVYGKLKAMSETFEIVYLQRTANRADQQSFCESFGTIPWLSLQFKHVERYNEMTTYFKVTTVPTLVIIGKDGRVLHFNAVDLIKEHGARAYPFTPEKLEHIVNANEINEEEVREANTLWPKKLQLHVHDHQLVPSLRRSYICDCCNQEGKVWSYCCNQCDFDLHYECAVKIYTIITEQSSVIPSGSPHVICCLDRSCCLPFLSFFQGQ